MFLNDTQKHLSCGSTEVSDGVGLRYDEITNALCKFFEIRVLRFEAHGPVLS